MAQLKSTSVIGNLSVTDKIIASEIVANNNIKLGAGIITLEGQTGYITGTWLRTTANNALNSAASAICVQNGGWIYTRTPVQILSDMGVTATVTELNYTDGVTSPIQEQLNNKLSLSGGTLTGPLTISAGGTSSWNEGLRIAPASNGWTTLCLGSTAPSGTGSGVWSMHTYQGTFYLAHNGSSSGTPLLRGLANNGFAITGKLSVSDLLTATSGVKIGDKATIQYNATDDCIDISFA